MVINILNKKAAYYHAPKCGSRTVLGWNAILNNPDIMFKNPSWFTPSRISEYGEIRTRSTLFEGTVQDWRYTKVPVVDSPFRFCIIRDPVDRFLSGYTNRVLFHRREERFGPFERFIDSFDSLMSADSYMENHFRKQVFFYGFDPTIFHKIYTLDQLGELKNDLEDISNTRLPDLHLQQNVGVSRPKLASEQQRWIETRYADDYTYYWDKYGK